ncbi:MAG: bi-domain-containing oxidoreductase [Desulfomonile sp.]
MKQILQNQKTGVTEIAGVPCPQLKAGHVLIRNRTTLISAGTERTVVDFGKANLIEKARQNPEKVRMLLDRLKTNGLLHTVEAATHKLEQRIALGYCSAGVVLDVGHGVTAISKGDRVASNGKHAEVVSVPLNLCVKIADEVSYDEAAFTVIGAIGLQGVRLAQPTLGESFVVTGLGLVGLVTVQFLLANGCRVLGIDVDAHKLSLARQFGAQTLNVSAGQNPVNEAMAFSRGRGVDGVIITAATKSNEPVHQAAQMCRKRGRIVLVGVVGLELSRDDFYEKELSFQVSCSYGPGRYDPLYEEGGHDYPIGFVRWTEQRNLEAMMDLLESRKVDVNSLISHRFPLERAADAYGLLTGGDPYLGILLEYSGDEERPDDILRTRTIRLKEPDLRLSATDLPPVVGFIGAGDHAYRVLIPAFRKTGAVMKTIAASTGTSCLQAGRKYGFREATTDTNALINDPEVNVVVIATRHNTHAHFVNLALKAGKHVFVEKPLALSQEELNEITRFYSSHSPAVPAPLITVGFNRRFAPQTQKIKSLIEGMNHPKCLIMTVNAGLVPPDHWTQDPAVGGGRILGEACHFIDLLRYLIGFPIISAQAAMIGEGAGEVVRNDKASFTLIFADGSLGTVHYLANGHRSFPKERLEIFCNGRILQLDDFKKLKGYGWHGFKKFNLWRQDKGHAACAAAFVKAVREGGPFPIPLSEMVEVTEVSFLVDNLLKRQDNLPTPVV